MAMIEPSEFIEALAVNNYKIVSGVPCSNIGAVFHALENTKRLIYVPAATEGEAIGVATGSWLAGKKAAVICQNSGVGNMINPLASLNNPYGIPVTLFVSMRGAVGFPDEAQHEIMGCNTQKFLELTSVRSVMLPHRLQILNRALADASTELLNRRSYAFLINPKVVNNPKVVPLVDAAKITKSQQGVAVIHRVDMGKMATRQTAIEILMQTFYQCATIATTGHAYRELYATGDRPNYFYMVGSMGHAASIGLGVSVNTKQPTLILDGDGALLMKLGTCATIGRQAPANLLHIVLDNGLFESTGGQRTNSGAVDFSRIAQACSYRQVWQCRGREAIEKFSQEVDIMSGPTFAHIMVSPSDGAIAGRPKIDLQQLAIRFRESLSYQIRNS